MPPVSNNHAGSNVLGAHALQDGREHGAPRRRDRPERRLVDARPLRAVVDDRPLGLDELVEQDGAGVVDDL